MTPLRELRAQRGWTQRDLARHSGVSIRTISSVEHGRTCRHPTRKRLLEALGLEWQDREWVFQ